MQKQTEMTALTWGCGHVQPVYLAADAVLAAEQIAAYTQIPCQPCAKAAKLQTRGICWGDPR